MAETLSPVCGRPAFELGAPSPGGLRLPDAMPSASTLYGPRGLAFSEDGQTLVVADTGNHRLLIWHDWSRMHCPAELVLGQREFKNEGPQAAGAGPERGLHLPTGVVIHRGRLLVCDAWNHRLLVWNEIPTRNDVPADFVLGQRDLTGVLKNRGGAIGPSGFDCPYGAAVIDGNLYVTDTQNRRVLIWDGVPDRDEAATAVMGQDDFHSGEENRGCGVGPNTMRWPHALASTGRGELILADAGNHRLLAWNDGAPRNGNATLLVGQEHYDLAFELPHRPQGPARLRFPYGLVADAQRIFVADTANNRILRWNAPLEDRRAADGVLGQREFNSSGENRWEAVASDTLCWPYGLALHSDLLAVADSGNNRVIGWHVDAHTGPSPTS